MRIRRTYRFKGSKRVSCTLGQLDFTNLKNDETKCPKALKKKKNLDVPPSFQIVKVKSQCYDWFFRDCRVHATEGRSTRDRGAAEVPSRLTTCHSYRVGVGTGVLLSGLF